MRWLTATEATVFGATRPQSASVPLTNRDGEQRRKVEQAPRWVCARATQDRSIHRVSVEAGKVLTGRG